MGVTRILHAAGNYREKLTFAAHPEVDAIEADIWLRAGKVFVNHARPLGPLPYTISSVGIRHQELDCVDVEHLLDAVDGCAQLVLDLRSWVGDPAPDLVRILYPVPDRSHLLVCCESWPIADRLRAWMPDLRVAYSIRTERDLRRYIQGRIEGSLGETPVTVKHALLRAPRELEALQRWSGHVGVWTVDDHRRARELMDWGAQSVTSNHVEVLAALA
jgi:hypothetical protein